MANKKCPICKKQYPDLISVSEHIETTHNDTIPKDWSGAKYFFFSNHGRTTGKCRICKKDTKFNEVTGKPEIMCTNKKCHDIYRQNFVNNMMNKHGKSTLLNDPEMQKKMLSNRSITKKYKWSDGTEKICVGSYEYDFAQFLDTFMNFDSNDVMFPAPMVIEYEYNGGKHFYIPDVFIGSLNLIVEIKDGSNNPNTRPGMVAVDKVKEKAKEDAIKKQGKYNYVKVPNKEYGIFIETLLKLKEQENVGNENEKIVPVVMIREYAEILSESYCTLQSQESSSYNINIIRFHVNNFPILEYGLNIDDMIFVYRNGIVCMEDVNNITVKESYRFKKNLFDSEYQNLIESLKSMVNRSYNDDDINDVNFPFYSLYEYTAADVEKNEILRDRILGMDSIEYLDDNFDFVFKETKNKNKFINESVQNIDMNDIDIKVSRTIEELNLYNPTRYELDISKLIVNAETLELLDIPKIYLISVYDQMKHALLNTLIELQTIRITVKNQ